MRPALSGRVRPSASCVHETHYFYPGFKPMAEPAPPVHMPPPGVTDADLETRRNLSRELGGYLDKIERQIDAVNLHLQEGGTALVLGPHQLLRSIKYRPDEQAALAVLESFGDAAPAVLSCGDFAALAATAFGPVCALAAAIKKYEVASPPASLAVLHDAAQKPPAPAGTSPPPQGQV